MLFRSVETVSGNAEATIEAPSYYGSPAITLPAGNAGAQVTFSLVSPTDPVLDTTPFKLGDDTTYLSIAATGATGPFTVCFPDTGSLTLWHYEDGAWVDMTWRDFDGSGNPIPDGLSRTGHSGEVCGKTLQDRKSTRLNSSH